MMKSALPAPLRYPTTVRIGEDDAHIDAKLRQLLPIYPGLDGGVTNMRLDHRAVTLDERLPNILSSGAEEIHLIDKGYSIHVLDGVSGHDWSVTGSAARDSVRLRITFDGLARYESGESWLLDEGSTCLFIVQPADVALTGVYRRGVAYRYCSLDLSREYLKRRLGLSDDDLPASLIAHWRNREVAFGTIAPQPSVLAAARRLFELKTQGAWRRLEAQAIAGELVLHLLRGWRDQGIAITTLARLRPREREALTRLKDHADACHTRRVTMAEAERRTGLNRNKIHYGFKEMFGTSLHRYCTDNRMRLASEMLAQTPLPVAEIAERLGFSEVTNFCAAFARHLSLTPLQFRHGRTVGRP